MVYILNLKIAKQFLNFKFKKVVTATTFGVGFGFNENYEV